MYGQGSGYEVATYDHPLASCGMQFQEGRIEVRDPKCACPEPLLCKVPLGQRFHLTWKKVRAMQVPTVCKCVVSILQPNRFRDAVKP